MGSLSAVLETTAEVIRNDIKYQHDPKQLDLGF